MAALGLLTPGEHSPAIDVSTKQERGGFLLSFILPLFIVIWSITGGMYTAMDVSAGEKERSTLEALLLTPATRLEITLGKLLAVATVAFMTIVAALSSMVYSLARFPIADDAGRTVQGADRPQYPAADLPAGHPDGPGLLRPGAGAGHPGAQLQGGPELHHAAVSGLVPAGGGDQQHPRAASRRRSSSWSRRSTRCCCSRRRCSARPTRCHAAVTLLSLLVFAALAVAITVYMFTREKVLLKT